MKNAIINSDNATKAFLFRESRRNTIEIEKEIIPIINPIVRIIISSTKTFPLNKIVVL